jgi:hypothetical protein
MGKKLAVLFLTLTLLSGFSGWYIATGIRVYSRYQSQEHCGGQSPVHICVVQAQPAIFSAYYPYYVATHANLFTINYYSSSPITLIVSANIVGFSQPETHTVNATASMQSISFTPQLLNSQVLPKLTSDDNTSLHVSVIDAARHVYYVNDSPLLLHSRWVMQWSAANRLKIAAWVTPDDQMVIALVSRATKHLQLEPAPIPRAMIGYDNGRASSRAVRDQVDAIFDAMRLDYHIQYRQESVPYSGPGDTSVALQNIQNIKLPAEVLQLRSGMCIELTALLASAVENIGLDAEIVIIPGHAFLGVAVTQNNTQDTQFEYWDAVQVNENVAGDSANLWADDEYKQNAKQIVDTILISAARKAYVGPMLQ